MSCFMEFSNPAINLLSLLNWRVGQDRRHIILSSTTFIDEQSSKKSFIFIYTHRMNVKKMFAASTGVLMLATLITPAVNGAANYGAELTGAYEYAFSKGITTMSSIDNANMYGEITRGQLAKMISNWAEKELGTKVDATKVCSFTDTNTAEGDLAAYLTKSCQMGLMGQGIDAFRPNAKVTRGEFGTTLSRALWGNKYNGATPFYANHLQALKDAGIMTKIENPSQLEIRGYVMLMLQRSSAESLINKVVNTGDNNTGANTTGVVKAGDLAVSVVDYSSSVKTAPKGIFVANKIKFAATENVSLESLTLKRTGLSTRTDVEKVWLEKNGVAVTNSASMGSDGVVVLNFKNGKNTVTSAADTQEFDLVVKFKKTADTGNELALDLVGATASAKNITVSGSTTTFRISGYTVVSLKVDDVNNTAVSYQVGKQSDYVIGQFALESDSQKDDRDIHVRSLTFRNIGSADFAGTFKNVKVYRDSKVVSNKVEVNGRDITISLDKDVIKANKRAVYTVRAEIATMERVGQTVQLQLRSANDLIADESDTGFRANVSFDSSWNVTNEGSFAVYTFNGGRVLLETKNGFPRTVEAGVGASDVVVAEGKIVVSEAVELPKIEIPFGGTNGWATNDPIGKDTIKRLVLEVGGTRYTADNTNGKFVFENVSLRNTADVKLYVSLDSRTTEGNEITLPGVFGSSLMIGNGEYTVNGEKLDKADVAGGITLSKVLIKKAKFQLGVKTMNTQSTVINDSARKLVFNGTLSSKDYNVNVNSFKVKLLNASNLAATESVDVFFNVDGQPFSNATLKNGSDTFTFNSIGTIEAGKSLPVSIEVSPTISAAKDITLEVSAEGTDNNGNPTATSKEYSAKLEVKANASVNVTNTVASDRVVEPTVNAVLYEGTLDVSNGSTELNSFSYTETKGAALNVTNYKLYVDGDFVADSTTPNFTALTQNLEQGKRVITVRANVESNPSTNGDDYAYKASDVTVNGVNSYNKANAYFAKGLVKLAKTSSGNKSLKFVVEVTGSNVVNVKAITVDVPNNLQSMSVNGVQANVANGVLISPVSIAAGSNATVEMATKSRDEGIFVTGVEYTVTDGGNVYTYKLTRDNNSSVANWIDLTNN